MLAAGLGIFGLIGAAARYSDKASRMPYVSCSTNTHSYFVLHTSYNKPIPNCNRVKHFCLITMHLSHGHGNHMSLTSKIWQHLCDWLIIHLPSHRQCCLQVPREYPYDGLKEELGGFDVKGSTQH